MQHLQVTPLEGYPVAIGRALWALEEVRRRTLRVIDGLGQSALDWDGTDGSENAIGSLLYHIAGIEMDWLHLDILGLTALPDAVQRHFPVPGTEADGKRLKRVRGMPLDEHVARLKETRTILLDTCRTLTDDDWRTMRPDPLAHKYEVSPEWAVFHLVEHEAGHTGQICSLKARFARQS